MKNSSRQHITLAVRQEASRILKEGLVQVLIGFEAGTLPLKAQPAFITRPDEVEKLIFNGFCQNNLAAYLTRRPEGESIGMICRGCESRAIRALTTENQVSRDKLYLIGIPCPGILDWRKIEEQAGGQVIRACEREGEEIMVTTSHGEHRFHRTQMLHESCASCLHPNPIGVDIILGELLPEGDREPAQGKLKEFETRSAGERYAFLAQESERCIRCYACREACPMCYCTQCFVDHTTPRWTESMNSPGGTQAWHIIRAFHQTGRCVSCGACERACPMDIKMTFLTEKLNDDMRKLYRFEAGLSDEQPPLAAFSPDDKNWFLG
jgi:formate dehydrogenase subunit beta